VWVLSLQGASLSWTIKYKDQNLRLQQVATTNKYLSIVEYNQTKKKKKQCSKDPS